MLNLNLFVEAIHDSIIKANEALMQSNVDLLEKYFYEGSAKKNKTLVPKTVLLEYPFTTPTGEISTATVQVPLITLIPLSSSQIEKATLSVEFDMAVVEGKLQLDFASQKPDAKRGKIEIVISPRDSSEGLKTIVQGYESMLKRQIS